MADYKYINQEQTGAIKYSDPNTVFTDKSPLWESFQIYIDEGGEVDLWKTTDDELYEAKEDKKQEIIHSYNTEESTSIITAGLYDYNSNKEHLQEVLTERQLAIINSESTMVVFDSDNYPHEVSISAVDTVLLQIRTETNTRRDKFKGLITQINEATTTEIVNNITW